MRYHDGEPSLVEGLLSRGDRRVGAVIERVWRDGGRFDGWSEHFSFARWIAAADAELPTAVDLAWFTTRERDGDEVLPWDHLDSGLDKQWLWDDWQDALGEFEQDDCRWTPCFDCGVCSNLGTDIQIGPTGRSLLPLAPKSSRRCATRSTRRGQATLRRGGAGRGARRRRRLPACARPRLAPTAARKVARDDGPQRALSPAAGTVAVRGTSRSRAISPNPSPGPWVRPYSTTSTSPVSTTKNS